MNVMNVYRFLHDNFFRFMEPNILLHTSRTENGGKTSIGQIRVASKSEKVKEFYVQSGKIRIIKNLKKPRRF